MNKKSRIEQKAADEKAVDIIVSQLTDVYASGVADQPDGQLDLNEDDKG